MIQDLPVRRRVNAIQMVLHCSSRRCAWPSLVAQSWGQLECAPPRQSWRAHLIAVYHSLMRFYLSTQHAAGCLGCPSLGYLASGTSATHAPTRHRGQLVALCEATEASSQVHKAILDADADPEAMDPLDSAVACAQPQHCTSLKPTPAGGAVYRSNRGLALGCPTWVRSAPLLPRIRIGVQVLDWLTRLHPYAWLIGRCPKIRLFLQSAVPPDPTTSSAANLGVASCNITRCSVQQRGFAHLQLYT